jgi:hypothetical protein
MEKCFLRNNLLIDLLYKQPFQPKKEINKELSFQCQHSLYPEPEEKINQVKG